MVAFGLDRYNHRLILATNMDPPVIHVGGHFPFAHVSLRKTHRVPYYPGASAEIVGLKTKKSRLDPRRPVESLATSTMYDDDEVKGWIEYAFNMALTDIDVIGFVYFPYPFFKERDETSAWYDRFRRGDRAIKPKEGDDGRNVYWMYVNPKEDKD